MQGICFCGEQFYLTETSRFELKVQLESAIGFGSFAAKNGLIDTEKAVRTWIKPVLARMMQEGPGKWKKTYGKSIVKLPASCYVDSAYEVNSYLGSLTAEILFAS